ncbi:MAG: HXXEE domain-containing protein [Gemmatimonadaceae bacterium]|nr:HXXEE domain-containing protein [Gemmatimonadaceae bacterium]
MTTSWLSPLPSRPFHGLLLAAPLIFVAHVVEEAPGFVTWVNAHIDRDITQEMFWTVNLTGLGITLLVVLFEWASRSKVSAIVALAWLGFVMVGNAVLHTTGALIDRAYAPGVITALLLYVPFSAWVIASAVRTRRVSAFAATIAVVLGALPMLAHGYMILFRSTRLF